MNADECHPVTEEVELSTNGRAARELTDGIMATKKKRQQCEICSIVDERDVSETDVFEWPTADGETRNRDFGATN